MISLPIAARENTLFSSGISGSILTRNPLRYSSGLQRPLPHRRGATIKCAQGYFHLPRTQSCVLVPLATLPLVAYRCQKNRHPKKKLVTLCNAMQQTASVEEIDDADWDDDDEVEGQVCTILTETDEGVRGQIPDEVLSAPWAPLLDKVKSLAGPPVRACEKHVKQLATIGPASSSEEMMERLFLCGVDVFRLNFSHGDHEEKVELVKRIRKLEKKYQHPIGILADLQGPKQRCGKFQDPEGVTLAVGQLFRFDLDSAPGDDKRVQLPHPEILTALQTQSKLLLDDGKIQMRVKQKGYTKSGEDFIISDPSEWPDNESECSPFVQCEVEVGGVLSAKKGVNTPDVVLPISPITEKDRSDLIFACQKFVDWIALSFVQRSEDMRELRTLVCKEGGDQIKLLAKIEKPSAVDDLAGILKESDGVMVARGDLGVEMNPEEVPFVQKDIVSQAVAAGKPVIVATQMLESMISSPSPTRAECSDIANAVIDGCDAVMLSGETAVGKFAVESVEMQRRVVTASQRSGQQLRRSHRENRSDSELSPENAIAASAVTLARGIGAKAIIVFTRTGRSVKQLMQLRPPMPILAICPCLETARWLSLVRGVYGTSDSGAQALASRVYQKGPYAVRFAEAIEVAMRVAGEKGLASSEDDRCIVLARLPLFQPGELNCIRMVSALEPGSHGFSSENAD